MNGAGVRPGRLVKSPMTNSDLFGLFTTASKINPLALIACLFFCAWQAQAGTFSVIGESRWVKVEYIFDGDTFATATGERIRLLGINAPEVTHGSEPGQVMGNAATRALKRMITGKTVRLAFDRERRDVYGRTLAQVWRRDGTWVNGEMVRRGLAHVYTFTPNLRWAKQLLTLERPARKQHLGIWNTKRFSVLPANRVKPLHIGQFHVVTGTIKHVNRNGFGFRLARLNISVPRKYRRWFKPLPRLRMGQTVTVHGVIRAGHSGSLYLALHSPFDLETLAP